MTIICFKHLKDIREKHIDKEIVFCSGSFDLIHAGHILFLEECKKYGDILVAMLGGDNDINQIKGNQRPILNEKVRIKILDSLKPVDYCLIGHNPNTKNPLLDLANYFKDLKPDIYVINKDAFNILERIRLIKMFNLKLLILDRNCPQEFENISTTKIIEKIKGLEY